MMFQSFLQAEEEEETKAIGRVRDLAQESQVPMRVKVQNMESRRLMPQSLLGRILNSLCWTGLQIHRYQDTQTWIRLGLI